MAKPSSCATSAPISTPTSKVKQNRFISEFMTRPPRGEIIYASPVILLGENYHRALRVRGRRQQIDTVFVFCDCISGHPEPVGWNLCWDSIGRRARFRREFRRRTFTFGALSLIEKFTSGWNGFCVFLLNIKKYQKEKRLAWLNYLWTLKNLENSF